LLIIKKSYRNIIGSRTVWGSESVEIPFFVGDDDEDLSTAVGGVLDVEILEDEVELAISVKTFRVGLNSFMTFLFIIKINPKVSLARFFTRASLKSTYRSSCVSERSFCNFDLVMFKTGCTSGTVTGSVVHLCELLNARELPEGERSAAAELCLKTGDQLRVDQLLGGLEGFAGIDLSVNADFVVVRVGTVNQDKDVVLGFGGRTAEALAADSDIVELGLCDDGNTGVDVDSEK